MATGQAAEIVQLITECKQFFRDIVIIAKYSGSDYDPGYLLSDTIDELEDVISDIALHSLKDELETLGDRCDTFGISLHKISCEVAEEICPELVKHKKNKYNF